MNLRGRVTILALPLALVLTAEPAGAVKYFVMLGATGDGSSSQPFGTIQEALDVAESGDTVTVRAGFYEESVRTRRDGQAGQPITVRAEPGGEPVVLSVPGRVLRVDHAHLVIDGIVFDGQYGAQDTLDINDGAHSFTIQNAEVRRSGRDCVDIGSPENVLIENTLIHHCLYWDGKRRDAHGVTGGSVQHLVIRNSEIHTFSGDAIQFDPGRELPGWNDIRVEGCQFWLEPLGSAENGFAMGVVPGENAVDTKTNNDAPRAELSIVDTTAWGFRGGLISNQAAFNIKEKVEVRLNRVTVFDSEIAFRLRGPTSSRPGSWVQSQNLVIYDVDKAFRYEDDIENLRIWNSTIGSQVLAPFEAASASQSVPEVKNLLLLGSELPDEALANSSNLTMDSGGFVDAPNHDYHLTSGAKAVDQGEELIEVVQDRDGVERPQQDAYDVGAYEFCDNDCLGVGSGGMAGASFGASGMTGVGGSSGDLNAGGSSTIDTNSSSEEGGSGCGCGIFNARKDQTVASLLVGLGLLLARRRRR